MKQIIFITTKGSCLYNDSSFTGDYNDIVDSLADAMKMRNP